jgi:MFS family permease
VLRLLAGACWPIAGEQKSGAGPSVYYIVPLVGPAIGPAAGAYITQHLGWRWMFYITSLLGAGVQIAGLIWLDETFAPTLLARKAKRLKIQTSNQYLYTEYDQRDQCLHRVLAAALIHPCKLLGT